MSNMNEPQTIEHTVKIYGKTYKKTIRWYPYSEEENELTTTSNDQKEKLQKLLYELTKVMIKTSAPAAYRLHATTKKSYTIIPKEGGHYRIDNQKRLNLKDSDPRLNIQYQIGNYSHAQVLVRMKPVQCPPDIEVGLIDEDFVFGFAPGNTVMGFIEAALKYSAEHQCYTKIEWTIKEVDRDRSRSRSRSRDRSADRSSNVQIMAVANVERVRSRSTSGSRNRLIDRTLNTMSDVVQVTAAAVTVGAPVAIKVGVKTSAKVAAKTTVKVVVKETTKQGTKSIVKKVPLVGLGFGVAFACFRLVDGDQLGALGELTSGAVSCIPGVGTAASIAVDTALLARDLNNNYYMLRV